MSEKSSSALNILIIQHDIIWMNIRENIRILDRKIKDLNERYDLILLPEMFSTGFTLNPELLPIGDQSFTVEWMKNIAIYYQCTIAGSMPFASNDKHFNRLFCFNQYGQEFHYNKRHLFPMQGENMIYQRGEERIIINVNGWKILPLICYDLRFPVWSRNNLNYDLILYLSNWPAARNSTWDTLLKARAIENQCYVAGVNRTGTDGNSIRYIGNSQVISPTGDILCQADAKAATLPVIIDKRIIDQYRKKFPVLDDRDEFKIEI